MNYTFLMEKTLLNDSQHSIARLNLNSPLDNQKSIYRSMRQTQL